MTEALLYPWLVRGMFLAAAITVASVFFVTAPYGRHARGGWGPSISTRAGWILMEAPAALVFLLVFLLGRHRDSVPALVLASAWLGHYGYRAFVYPFRLRAPEKPMPLSIAAMGGAFCTFNGYLNARWVSEMHRYSPEWMGDIRLWGGILLFAAGWMINQHSDAVLLALRKPGEAGYRIPVGGLYRWISCPNYFGEVLEWCGWALATWSLPGLGFALYTAANLVPRALDHHRWYQKTFPDYPKERRAVLPFLL